MADKKITDLQQVSEITESLNFPVDDTLQTYRATIGQVKTYLAPIYIAPSIQKFTSGSGTYERGHAFIVSGASATVGATYTNNGNTYTVLNTVSSANIVWLSGSAAPTASGTLTKASGTGDSSIAFSSVRNPIYLKIKMVGGGGGGAGSGTGAGGTVTSGGNTTFGSSLLTANGGSAGIYAGSGANGGSGSISSPAIGFSTSGGAGLGGEGTSSSGQYTSGGDGGLSHFQGNGQGGRSTNGYAAQANSGSGGGGGGNSGTANFNNGGGGGAGGYVEATIASPSYTYSYAVGSNGTGGTAGTSGYAGGNGGSGLIIVEEHYQ